MTLTSVMISPADAVRAYLLVLVGGNGDELRLFEDVRPEGAVRQLEDVIGADEMETRLVLLHRVEYRLYQALKRIYTCVQLHAHIYIYIYIYL